MGLCTVQLSLWTGDAYLLHVLCSCRCRAALLLLQQSHCIFDERGAILSAVAWLRCRCHYGPCSKTCRELVTKTCRCGRTEKQVLCHTGELDMVAF
jgi:hypothetical protein